MCKIEGICLECMDSENCPMIAAHRRFPGTLRSVMCMAFRPAAPSGVREYSPDAFPAPPILEAVAGRPPFFKVEQEFRRHIHLVPEPRERTYAS